MKITRSIRVWSKNKDELLKLDCLEFVREDARDKKQITCRFKNGVTQGSPIAHTGDYLVQYETGKWQRVGANVISTLVFNPKANANRHTGGASW